jgi:hypothetical protein
VAVLERLEKIKPQIVMLAGTVVMAYSLLFLALQHTTLVVVAVLQVVLAVAAG